MFTMGVLPPLPINNTDQITTVKIYTSHRDYINENIPGTSFAERLQKILRFHQKNYGLTPFEMMDDNLVNLVETVVKKLKE